jgi:hypothetical protein
VIAGDEISDDRTDLLGVPILNRDVYDIESRDRYVCGPPTFLEALTRRSRYAEPPPNPGRFTSSTTSSKVGGLLQLQPSARRPGWKITIVSCSAGALVFGPVGAASRSLAERQFSSVVFPDPDGPVTARNSP